MAAPLTIDTCQVLPHGCGAPDMTPTTRTYVRLRVHDTGTGIDPATKAKIPSRFYDQTARSGNRGSASPPFYGIVHQSGGQSPSIAPWDRAPR